MQLQEQMQRKIKMQGKSAKTFETYWVWCTSYLIYLRDANNGEWRHPRDAGRSDIEAWLTWLAVEKHHSKNSQNVALQSVLYLYREILGIEVDNVQAMRSKRPQHVRDVLSVEEIRKLFGQLNGVPLLAAQMMYGCGFRISDLVGIRIKDISFDRRQIVVRATKGDKWRYTSFPECIHAAVQRQIESVRVVWNRDETENPNGVSLPDRLRVKMPRSARQLAWYFLFPSDTLSRGDDGVLCRHHRHPDHLARTIKDASERAGILKRVTSHVLRHSYATHAHEQGVPMRILQQLLGHNDIRTTEVYVHADEHQATSAQSPLEQLLASSEPMRSPLAAKSAKPALRLFVG